MADLRFLDTNILLYAVSRNPDDAMKSAIARRIILDERVALSVQVCQEFINIATCRKPGFGFRFDEARELARGFRHLPIQETTLSVLDRALALVDETGYSIWDTLIVAAAQALGCTILYSEDMQDGRVIGDLRLLNPFRAGAVVP